jgi:ABC-type branched-subunit amino acid transport system substrate-binding protein
VPLTGAHADYARALVNGARLGLENGPALDVRDTGGTPGGAARAAQESLAGGDTLILGPLTAGETVAAAQVAAPAHLNMLAFTNDASAARSGVWTLGITPRQQVRRLVVALRAQGKSRIAALLPDSEFGRAMAAALRDAAAEAGLSPPDIRIHARGSSGIATAVQGLTGYTPPQATPAAAPRTQINGGIAGAPEAQAETPPPPAPPPAPQFDALLLAETGPDLAPLLKTLAASGVTPATVRIVGPALWSNPRFAAQLPPGAWFASPDPAARESFSALYNKNFQTPAPPIADLAYDAAAIARSAPGTSEADLTRVTFAGVDGLLALDPNGGVRRGLAVFEIQPGGGTRIAEPAPASFAPAGS